MCQGYHQHDLCFHDLIVGKIKERSLQTTLNESVIKLIWYLHVKLQYVRLDSLTIVLIIIIIISSNYISAFLTLNLRIL